MKFTLPLSQKEIYNITQKIVTELSNLESRTILFSIIKNERTVEEIAEIHKIPLSTVYKKLKTLEELSLVYIQKMNLSYRGKRIKFYKSRIKKAIITMEKAEPSLVLE